MKNKLLLLLGPTGVGKSTIINKLKDLDSRFVYISPFTTRPLRPNEKDKIHLSIEEFKEMEKNGKFVFVNNIYGNYYGTPRDAIIKYSQEGLFPLLDWPIQKIDKISLELTNNILSVYLRPSSLDYLKSHLSIEKRDDKSRLETAIGEYNDFVSGKFYGMYDFETVNREGKVDETVSEIYKIYLKEGVGKDSPIKLKHDSYRSARGGTAKLLDIYCRSCDSKVAIYQKDGPGELKRCYLNRFMYPPSLSSFEKRVRYDNIKDVPNFVCNNCNTVLGTPFIYSDGRLTFALRPGMVTAKRSKLKYK